MKLPSNFEFEYNGEKVLLIPGEVVNGTKQYQVNVGRGAPTHFRSKLIVGIGWQVYLRGKRHLGRATKNEARQWAKDKIDGKF